MAETKIRIRPQTGKQWLFFASHADIAIYGGAAGGGKTWALTVEPIRKTNKRGFSGIIFRRTYPQIMNPGGLWDAVSNIYPLFGGKSSDTSWYFDNGDFKTEINFSHMQLEKDKFNFQGAEIPFIGFDELTHFSEGQFFYMCLGIVRLVESSPTLEQLATLTRTHGLDSSLIGGLTQSQG